MADVDPQHAFATIAAASAAVAGLGYLARTFLRTTRRMLAVADVILGCEEHPPLAERLDAIEHELVTNNGSSLRDVADRVEETAKALRCDIRANALESKERREQDRVVLDALAARVDAVWDQNELHDPA